MEQNVLFFVCTLILSFSAGAPLSECALHQFYFLTCQNQRGSSSSGMAVENYFFKAAWCLIDSGLSWTQSVRRKKKKGFYPREEREGDADAMLIFPMVSFLLWMKANTILECVKWYFSNCFQLLLLLLSISASLDEVRFSRIGARYEINVLFPICWQVIIIREFWKKYIKK